MERYGIVLFLNFLIQTGGIAQAYGVGGRKNTEVGVRGQHLVLVQHGETAILLQHLLNYKHHVGPPGVIFVKINATGR